LTLAALALQTQTHLHTPYTTNTLMYYKVRCGPMR